MTPLRAFLRHFREAIQRERPEPRIVAGHIVVRRDPANRCDRG